MMKNEVVYNDGELELKVPVNSDTIWLKSENIAEVFGVNRPAVVKHIGNIYKSQELGENSTCSIMEQVARDGKKRKIKYYNLDIIIAVGYRINSKKATRFRIWATNVLKEYIFNGYAINREKITQQRLLNLENDVGYIKSQISSKTLEAKQGIFHNGQIYDAYSFLNDLCRSAKLEMTLIDNYTDDTVLTLFSKYPNLKFTIITKSISKQLKLDIERYSEQYKNLEIKISNKYHDRFLLIDKKEAYHIGASLKDLGKKIFAFNSIDIKLIMDMIDE